MKALKLLYIDTPFIGFDSGDKNRSKFLYKSLREEYDTDILLIKDKSYTFENILSHRFNNQVYTFRNKKQKWYKSPAVLNFDKAELKKIKSLILKNSYDICFFRMSSLGILAQYIKKEIPSIKIIVDVDMIFSQISKVAWSLNRTIKNRYHFFEYHKLSFFEKKFFNKDYTFLYTNKNELNLVKKKYHVSSPDNHFVLPNVINEIESKIEYKIKDKFILFYGVLNSTANLSAYEYLIEKIYPLIKNFLISNDIKIYIVGKNATEIHKRTPKNVKLIGEVDNIISYIKQSIMVLFPLTVASGTLTRILEVANMKKSIVATKVAASGLGLEGKIFIANNEVEIVEDILTIYDNEALKVKYEELAFSFVQKNYSFENVKKQLYSCVKTSVNKTSVIHIPRRFTKSHWGGTENVVMSLAKGLRNFNIKSRIVTTNILSQRKDEVIDSVSVKRFNYFYPYFNLSNNSKKSLDLVGGNLFSWSMFSYLFFVKDIDLIHLHTAKRMGSIARTICKLRGIPYVITIHGGLYDINENEKQNRMEPTKNTFEWGKVLGFLFGSRRVYDDANSIITLNKNEYENTKKNYPNKSVYLLSNSVNIKSFEIKKDETFRKRHNISENSFVFLCSARIDKQKNQLLIIKAFEKLLLKGFNIHLLLVGNVTNEEYYQEITAYIKMKSLSPFVTVLTNLEPKSLELINSYLNSDSFVLASRHEPFGIVGLEAWASKLPLIISAVCGICNIIEDNKTALVFQDNCESELKNHMQNIINNEDLRKSLILNASKEVLNYDEIEVNKTLSKIYEKTIKSKKNK